MKKRIAFVCALVLLMLACALPIHAQEVTPEQEEQYGYLGEMPMQLSSGLTPGFSVKDATIRETSVLGRACLNLCSFGPDYGYAVSPDVPDRMKCEQARYVVIKYYNPERVQELGLIWRCQVASAGYNVRDPKTAQLEDAQIGWKYLIVDMSDHALWSGTLYDFGLLLYSPGSQMQYLWLQWIKFYSEDPTELYESIEEETFFVTDRVTQPPLPEPPETTGDSSPTYPPDTTEPVIADTDWETYETQEATGVWSDHDQIPDELPVERPGLFYEVFGDDALSGCQDDPLGCRGGGCNAITGGLFVLCLLAVGFIFRKEE